MQRSFWCFLTLFLSIDLNGQASRDSTSPKPWGSHFQLTVISQKHSGFRSDYSGQNSLTDTVEPSAVSLTTTYFLGRRLWKGASFYFNPEASGGKGLSFAKGVAGALNGETYRVGATEPQIFIARAYLQQHFDLGGGGKEFVTDDVNQFVGAIPSHRLTICVGKFSVSDFFDGNSYAKDPRSQFFNWSLWGNGAWDYPANTRGYTMGIGAKWVKKQWEVSLSSVAVPRIANNKLMEYSWGKAQSQTLELGYKPSLFKKQGRINLLFSQTFSKAPTYRSGMEAIAKNDTFLLNVLQGNVENTMYGGRKLAVGLNMEQAFSDAIGGFCRLGWNDGRYASWAFTEIDRSLSLGISVKGNAWKRGADVCAAAISVNGISADHKAYLQQGGYGFIIGDGHLDYGRETILETFYNVRLSENFWLTLDYQFIQNPGYNKDRGPLHVGGIRAHVGL